MKFKSILHIIKKGSGIIAGTAGVGAVSILPFDEILSIISALTSLSGILIGGFAHLIEVWAKATGRIPLDSDIDGK